MGRACGTYWRQSSCIQVFDGRPQGKRPFGRPRRRWEDDIKMDLQVIDGDARTGSNWPS